MYKEVSDDWNTEDEKELQERLKKKDKQEVKITPSLTVPPPVFKKQIKRTKPRSASPLASGVATYEAPEDD